MFVCTNTHKFGDEETEICRLQLDTNEGANARLIAAAPELLAALRVTLDALHNETHGDDDSPWMTSVKEQASAAIAKATS